MGFVVVVVVVGCGGIDASVLGLLPLLLHRLPLWHWTQVQTLIVLANRHLRIH